MQSAKLSILISCYNQRDFIEQAMRSFYKQDYGNIEMIVLDDGSIDDSFDVIASAAADAPFPVHRYKQHNQGAAKTFGNLANLATGDYLLFMGGDDFVPPNILKNRLECLEKDKNLFCASGLCRYYHNGNVGDWSFAGENNIRLNQYSASDMLALMRRYDFEKEGMLMMSSTIIRRQDFESAGGFSEKMIGDDCVLFYRLFKYAEKARKGFIVLPETVFYYRQHDNNTCKNPEAMWYRFSELYTEFGFNSRRKASFSAYATYMKKVRCENKWYQPDILKRIFQDRAVIKILTLGAICRDLLLPGWGRF
ncbi:MAG: glycosyltransferase family 2 protein [Lentisphaerae bacterium]|nr:glycosyltransferase family 2 protein [Lentisphaerota bacterium]